MDIPRGVEHMRHCLALAEALDEFRDYSPSARTGYAFDTSVLIKRLKQAVKKDNHCPASFSVCCMRLKESLRAAYAV